ncbi:TetR family transcriptional regulator [Streptomyces sp. NPDC002004]
MRDAIITAAFELFLDRGYESTTIDEIVALAGVGRRSFFRYFPTKEDVVFPDHERRLAELGEFLNAGTDDEDPIQRVCDAAREVARMYMENPRFSVQRYRLTRSVPGLRAHELSVVWRYERIFAEYLRRRYAGSPDGALRADVVASAVVAAHNNALRSWLRSGGTEDGRAYVEHALDYVREVWGGDGEKRAEPAEPDDVVVVISKRGMPMWRVVREIESSLGGD